MKIVMASDHAGYNLKQTINKHLQQIDIELYDVGTYSLDSVDYPDFCAAAARLVADGKYDRGIVICGTGIGASISANKVKGIRAALCHDAYTARACREHNDANVLALGERVTGIGVALDIVDIFLVTQFSAGRHALRLEKIKRLEQQVEVKENERN